MTTVIPAAPAVAPAVAAGTSGTVGQTTISVTDMIEHATRRCGVLPSTLSGEQQLAARQSLFMLCADLANRGLSLWCVGKQVLGMNANQSVINMPVGTVDLVNALYRTKTDLTGSAISGTGWQGLDVGSDQQVTNTAVQFTGDATVSLVLESSADLGMWAVQARTFPESQAVSAGQWLSFDADNSQPERYWRIRNTAGAMPAISILRFSNNPYEINMGTLNRDDFTAFPNKTFTQVGARTPVYWFDKQIIPRIWVWPASGDNSGQIVAWTHRQFQDVGAFSNNLEVPDRWKESIIWTLACRVAVELPKGVLPDGRIEYLEAKSAEHLTRAENGESDGSSFRLLPNIRGYTR
jgi:hypothetical protein